MLRIRRPTRRMCLIMLHDVFVSVLAVVGSFYLRFEPSQIAERWSLILSILPFFAIYVGVIYAVFGLYIPKWRFTSTTELFRIIRVATVIAISLLVFDYIMVSPNVYGGFFLGKATIILYWLLQIFFLGGPRLAYRTFRHSRVIQKVNRSDAPATLVLGLAADADVLLRAIESGAVRKLKVLGILSPSPADQRQSLRGVQVIGTLLDLERVVADFDVKGVRLQRLVFTPSALLAENRPEAILTKARRLGIAVSRLPSLDESAGLRLAPVAPEDLLLRPSVSIDYARGEGLVKGRRILVTGGGGSIGSEICRRVVAFGADRLMIIENSEPFLYVITEELVQTGTGCHVEARVADIRDRQRLFDLFREFRPDIVFHAAALKHVPVLERDWSEGVKTNVFGSVNVAEAAVAAGAKGVVMISTDKAVRPVSVLGVTKRFAEMYCQALDADLAASANGECATRLVAVRFGNVLASTGSVVPKFKAQIEAGGPVTVTHPDMVRYFMTIREASELVITAASHALSERGNDISVYVLNMGQPVRISDLADRMIRLLGLEPGIDIEVVFTGMRPGERLNETLFAPEEPEIEIGIPGIVAAKPVFPSLEEMRDQIVILERAVAANDRGAFERLQEAEFTANELIAGQNQIVRA